MKEVMKRKDIKNKKEQSNSTHKTIKTLLNYY